MTAPIALFVYNRPEHTRRTVEALRHNRLAGHSRLDVFADGPKVPGDANVAAVRAYIRGIDGFASVSIHEREANAGLARSIIDGVTRVCEECDRVIVLEDDMVTTPWFLD